jgi:hypothetical protein
MTSYRIAGRTIRADDPQLPRLLVEVYGNKTDRPLCICRTPGIPMQLAKVNGNIIIKRMPFSGGDHDPGCDSYEPPPEVSGLGQVMGSAIQEDEKDGTTTLKFAFPMSKTGNRTAPVASGTESDTVKADGNKLTLRATLHYLWDEAGFSKWWPNMAGKRSWYVIRKFLLQAAENKLARGADLVNSLYVPESFSSEKKNEISQRRTTQLMKIAVPEKGARRLMILIGEVKSIEPALYGHKFVVKQVPDYGFMIPDDLYKRMLKRFETELVLWDSNKSAGSHLIVIGTFSVNAAGTASIEECSLMLTTENWIPYENIYEKGLLDQLTNDNRRFVKTLRYNFPSTRPLASVVVTDTAPHPTAMYIARPNMPDVYMTLLNEMMQQGEQREHGTLQSWLWKTEEESMPEIPAAAPGKR